MNKLKCYQCGLVNRQGSVTCNRCNSVISDSHNASSPDHGETKKSFGTASVAILAAVLVAAAGGYYMFSSPAKAGVTPPAANVATVTSVSPEEFLKAKRLDAENAEKAKAADPQEILKRDYQKFDPKQQQYKAPSTMNIKQLNALQKKK